jgi:hypothetical protein
MDACKPSIRKLCSILPVITLWPLAAGLPAQVIDSVSAPGDTAAPAVADTVTQEPTQPLDPLVAFRSRSSQSLMFADTLSSRQFGYPQLTTAFPFFMDDLLRMSPAYFSGDTLGNGHSRQFSPLGGGFAAAGAYLNGMQLADPLTRRVDWRMVSPQIISQAAVLNAGRFDWTSGYEKEMAFGSYHAAGAHFTLADGSVHFLDQSIDARLYRDLGSRNGGEVIGKF